MKKILLIFLSLFIIGAFLSTCKKDKLPKATEKGANTFGCKINGVSFKPCENKYISDPTLYGGMDQTFNEAFVTAECNNPKPQRRVYIQLYNFRGVGDYLLSDSNNICTYKQRYPDKIYQSFLTGKGKVTITKDDRTNYILSGTFEFTAANQDNSNDVVTVTDGRFDVSYK